MKKSNGTLYWYGPGESVLAETDLSGNLIREFVYFNGARVARRDSAGSVYYFFSDHLGTARVMTNATGVTQQESTYYPFGGEQWAITNTVDNRYRFTGLERDGETGLDHTQFRKYSPIQARWLSPDPICSNCLDPQQLNRYSYARNDTVNATDPLGLEVWKIGNCYYDTVSAWVNSGSGWVFQGYDTHFLGCVDVSGGGLIGGPPRGSARLVLVAAAGALATQPPNHPPLIPPTKCPFSVAMWTSSVRWAWHPSGTVLPSALRISWVLRIFSGLGLR